MKDKVFIKHSRFFAILAGVFLAIVTLLIIEISLRVFNVNSPKYQRIFLPADYARINKYGILQFNPGKYKYKVFSAETGRKRKIYSDANCTIDEFSRRISVYPYSEEREKFFIVTGGSFAFGTGLNDDETMSSRIGQQLKGYKPYNYAIHGGSPSELLGILETRDLKEEVEETSGIVLYVYIDNHINRLIGSTRIPWRFNRLYYRYEKDHLKRYKNFDEAYPIKSKIYRILSESEIIKALNVGFPIFITEEHKELFARSIIASQQYFKNIYPDSRFVFVVYPGSRYGKDILALLKDTEIITLDHPGMLDSNDPYFYTSQYDGHPTSEAIAIFTDTIIKDLQDLDIID